MAGIDLGDAWAAGVWEEGVWTDGVWAGQGGGDVPGQAGELNAASRVIRMHGAMSLIRRTALVLALLLLGAL